MLHNTAYLINNEALFIIDFFFFFFLAIMSVSSYSPNGGCGKNCMTHLFANWTIQTFSLDMTMRTVRTVQKAGVSCVFTQTFIHLFKGMQLPVSRSRGILSGKFKNSCG